MLRHQFARYVAVGLLNTGFSYLVYALALWSGLVFFAANLIALLSGIIFSFAMQGRFVFDNLSRSLFPRYVVLWLAIYLVNITIIKLTMTFGFNAYTAGAIALGPIVALSYVLQKRLVFGTRNRPRAGDQDR